MIKHHIYTALTAYVDDFMMLSDSIYASLQKDDKGNALYTDHNVSLLRMLGGYIDDCKDKIENKSEVITND